MVEIEYVQDDIYYWLVFTVFFSMASIIGAIVFVSSYKVMVCLRNERLKSKVSKEFNLLENGSKISEEN